MWNFSEKLYFKKFLAPFGVFRSQLKVNFKTEAYSCPGALMNVEKWFEQHSLTSEDSCFGNWSRNFVWAWLRHTLIRLINCNDINNIIHSALNIHMIFFVFFFCKLYLFFKHIKNAPKLGYSALNIWSQRDAAFTLSPTLQDCNQWWRGEGILHASVIGIFRSHSVWVTVWGRTHNPMQTMHKIIIFFCEKT